MSTTFLLSLAVVVAVVMGARLLLTVLPLRQVSVRITVAEAVLALVGTAGLALHCLAMFFRDLVEPLPGADTAISDIRALGTVSVIWYVVPAVLVLLGLRRQHPVAVAGLALSLIAVAVTMFIGGSLQLHLATIFVSVVVAAAVAAMLVLPPWRADLARSAS